MQNGKYLRKYIKHGKDLQHIRILDLHPASIAPTSAYSFPFSDGT
jgi:hypothetical protein